MNVMEIEESVMDATADVPREKLRQIVEKNGETILQDQDRVEGLLRDHCGPYRKEISALVGALNERVPQELKGSWQTAMTPEAMRARLIQRLEDHRGLAPNVAEWAVDTWSYALGIGLGRRSDRLDSVVLGGSQYKEGPTDGGLHQYKQFDGGSNAATVSQLARSEEERRRAIESDRPGGAAAATGLLATVEQKKKAGIGAGALLLVAVAAIVAFNHHKEVPKTDPVVVVVPPTPVKPEVQKDQPVVTPPDTSIAAGTQISIRLNQGIESDKATVGQTFTATLAAPLILNGKTALPIGSDATIRIMSIDEGHKLTGQTVMDLALVELSSAGKTYEVSASDSPVLGPKQAAVAAERGAIGGAVGAVGGFISGKILHHPKAGTGVGTGVGVGVGVATTKPQPAKAKAEQLIRFKLSKALPIGA